MTNDFQHSLNLIRLDTETKQREDVATKNEKKQVRQYEYPHASTDTTT